VGTSDHPQPKQNRINLGYNSIGEEGCRHLSQGRWEHLATLDLSKNKINLDSNSIGDKGCRHLSQGRWEHLTTLRLGKTRLI
jgi:hypothetical protein